MVKVAVVKPAISSSLEVLAHDYLASCRARGLAPSTTRSGLRMIEQVYAHLNAADGYEAVMRMLTSER